MKGKLRIVLIVVGILIVLILIVPFLIPVNQFRPTIEEKAIAILRAGNEDPAAFRVTSRYRVLEITPA